jgi:hypothetical protein
MYTGATTELDLVRLLRFGAPAPEGTEEIPLPHEIWTGTKADARAAVKGRCGGGAVAERGAAATQKQKGAAVLLTTSLLPALTWTWMRLEVAATTDVEDCSVFAPTQSSRRCAILCCYAGGGPAIYVGSLEESRGKKKKDSRWSLGGRLHRREEDEDITGKERIGVDKG